ncbi:Anthocyanidin [Carex littledalei]|uniref:Glycosyltransferase n=1 Tax=Carex littledalei TaxID=544730 RepID=A0A833VI31_9POAL|nr:Anthocyanidin [Carex littledalei]
MRSNFMYPFSYFLKLEIEKQDHVQSSDHVSPPQRPTYRINCVRSYASFPTETNSRPQQITIREATDLQAFLKPYSYTANLSINQLLMKSKKVVLYPSMGAGHLVPMVELAKQFVRRGISVSIPVMTVGPASDLVSEICNSNPNISFHILPQVPPTNPHQAPIVNLFNMLKLNNDSLRSFLVEQSDTSPICGVVLDMFCVDALDVTYELGIPAYFFFTCGAASLAVFMQLPTYLATRSIGALKDIGKTPLLLPGVPPLPASHLPKDTSDPETEQYKLVMHLFDRLPEAKGILINSFELLEPRAVMALKDGLCLPNRSTPSIYCIGPLVARRAKKEEQHPCLSWLDAQPKESVVFLCFGSMGSFPVEQLKEIAIGLENSGQRFLWVVRSPSKPDLAKIFKPTTEPDLDILLPEGFLDRTRDRGMIVKHWAPQVEVLKHEAVGGFVSHCGWNSTLEAVSFGVPMICWPLYAEQKMNKVFLVEEMKVGIELKGYDEGLVQADELEAKLKWIIESEGAVELRNRMMEMKESAIEAMKEGGSSFGAFVEFLECLN